MGSGTLAFATGLNNLGDLVGYSFDTIPTQEGPQHKAFFYTRGKLINLGAGDAKSINDFPNAQGMRTTHAVLWQNGRMTDLNKLIPAHSGWVLNGAAAINDRGQIVCAGSKGACLLTPVINKKHRR